MARCVACLLLVLLAGCGSAKLTTDERVVVAEARLAIAETVLDGSQDRQAREGVDRLIALYREKPDAEYDELTMREVLQDAASDLGPYRPELASRLDRAAG